MVLLSAVLNPAEATPISVPNGSFESSSPAQTSTNFSMAPGWIFSVQDKSAFGIGSISSNFSSPGASTVSNDAFINNDYPGVTDTITSATSLGTITALTTYTLTVAIGNRSGSDSSLYHAPGNVSFSLLANGVPFATRQINNGTVPDGTFEDFSLTFTTPASGSLIGDSLKIQLAALPESGSAYQPAFDNVTLDAVTQAPTVVPEPSTRTLLVGGILALGWLTRRKLALA